MAAQSSFIQTAIWESSLLAKEDLNSITINLKKAIKDQVCHQRYYICCHLLERQSYRVVFMLFPGFLSAVTQLKQNIHNLLFVTAKMFNIFKTL